MKDIVIAITILAVIVVVYYLVKNMFLFILDNMRR
jgi:predicted secreted protein